MCVIFLVNKVRPTTEMAEKAWNANRDGGGIAWREKKNGVTKVCWKKGIMNKEDMIKLCAETPTPYVAHFRVASVGGVKPELTHPFLIAPSAPLELEGETEGGVLFHNGHWSEWQDKCLNAAIYGNVDIPVGAWSDTRGMAWLSQLYGHGFMEFLPNQKGIIMTPEGMDIFTGNGWEKVNDVWCSNKYFLGGPRRHATSMCIASGCTNMQLPDSVYCYQCKIKRKVEEANSTTALTTTTSNTGTGGSSTPTPFVAGGILTLREAELLHQRQDISKTLLKKIRKAHEQMQSPGKKGERAKKELEEHTAVILTRLSAGLPH
jgi:hypothetical protein